MRRGKPRAARVSLLGDTEYHAAWGEEIKERLRRIDAGEVETVPWSEARERIFRKAD